MIDSSCLCLCEMEETTFENTLYVSYRRVGLDSCCWWLLFALEESKKDYEVKAWTRGDLIGKAERIK
jgi:hypothetical protein